MCDIVPTVLASVVIVHHTQSSSDHKAPSNNKYRTVYSIILSPEGEYLQGHTWKTCSLGSVAFH